MGAITRIIACPNEYIVNPLVEGIVNPLKTFIERGSTELKIETLVSPIFYSAFFYVITKFIWDPAKLIISPLAGAIGVGIYFCFLLSIAQGQSMLAIERHFSQ